MADNRKDLKRADAEKSFGSSSQNVIVESVGATLSSLGSSKGRRLSVKRRLPVIVDIFIGIIILAIFVGIVVGAYFLFRYYTDDYEGIDIEYVFISPCEEDREAFRTVKNKELYFDADGNTLYFGKVSEIDVTESKDGDKYLVLTVNANAKFKSGEGYSVGDRKIAVGSEFSFRVDGRIIAGTVVELYEKGERVPLIVAQSENESERSGE